MKYLFTIIQLFIGVNIVVCQNAEPTIINYTKENGLPSNETYCVFRDSKGYLWVGTDKGVVRYDGTTFKKFELPDNVVFKIKEDDEGKIWFFTYSGKLAYHYNEKIYPYKHNDSIQKKIGSILIDDAHIFNNSDIYLKAMGPYDYLLKKTGEIQKFHFRKNLLPQKYQYDTICLNNDNELGIFVQTRRNLNVLNNTKLFTFIQDKINNTTHIKSEDLTYPLTFTNAVKTISEKIILAQRNQVILINKVVINTKYFNSEILCQFYNKKTNTIFIGFKNNGIVEINENLQVLRKYVLQNNSISSIYADNDGVIWATSTKNGLYKITPITTKKFQNITPFQTLSITTLKNQLFYSNIEGIFLIKDNYKVSPFFSYPNYGPSFLTSVSDSILLFNCNKTIKSIFALEIIKQNETVVLVLNNEKNPKLNKERNILFNPVTGYIVSYEIEIPLLKKNIANNNLDKKILHNYYSHTDSIINKYNDIQFYNDTSILLGTLNGLLTHNAKNGTTSPFITSSKIFDKGVNTIAEFKNKTIAVGLRFDGLVLLQNTTVLAQITEQQGLLSNSINYVYPDHDNLWLSTHNGISCITFQSLSPIKYTIKNFGKEVGLGNEIIYQIIRFNKDILAATSKGIFKLTNADSLLALPPKPIPFYITTISTYLGDTSNIDKISLPHNKNKVSINFNAIDFTTPTDIEYYYRIINTDSTWLRINNPQIILQDLSPGTYNVEMKATLPKQGRTSEVRQITITIEKPWWLKTISLLAFALGLISLFYLFTNWRIKRAKKATEKRNEVTTKMLKLEQNALQAQMNPHFIFNCLTGIQQLMNTNNIDEANEYLVTFSRLIRSTLENSTQEYIVLQNEIDYLNQYISLEEKRLTNELHTTFTIADNINTQTIEIPNMMLQPIIENAIRHGIKALENKAGKIEVNIELSNNTLQCSIEDNGIGREASTQNKMYGVDTHKSFGLSIIKQRLQGYAKSYNKDYSIEIVDIKNESGMPLGTRVTVYLPIKN